jgi:hypothetical protein
VSGDSGSVGARATSVSVSSANPLSESSGIAVVALAAYASMSGGTWPPTNIGWVDVHSSLISDFAAFAYFIFSSSAQLIAAISGVAANTEMAICIGIFTTVNASNTGLTPPVGAVSLSGNAATAMPATNNVIASLTAWKREGRLIVPERRIYLPARKAA